MKQPLPNENLEPTYTPLGVDPGRQAAALNELRALENEGRAAVWRRNDLICAQALSHSLSRPDMARAIGVSPSRVDQLIATHTRELDAARTAALLERSARHL